MFSDSLTLSQRVIRQRQIRGFGRGLARKPIESLPLELRPKKHTLLRELRRLSRDALWEKVWDKLRASDYKELERIYDTIFKLDPTPDEIKIKEAFKACSLSARRRHDHIRFESIESFLAGSPDIEKGLRLLHEVQSEPSWDGDVVDRFFEREDMQGSVLRWLAFLICQPKAVAAVVLKKNLGLGRDGFLSLKQIGEVLGCSPGKVTDMLRSYREDPCPIAFPPDETFDEVLTDVGLFLDAIKSFLRVLASLSSLEAAVAVIYFGGHGYRRVAEELRIPWRRVRDIVEANGWLPRMSIARQYKQYFFVDILSVRKTLEHVTRKGADMNKLEKLLSIEEVSSELKLSAPTIRRLMGTGEMTSIKVGKFRRFRESDIEDFIQRSQSGAERNGAGYECS